MTTIYVHTGAEYISYGSSWREGSGNVVLANDISFNTKQLNDVSLNDLYTGFNATLDGNGFTITITPFSSMLNYLNEGLIRDLSGGTIKNINIDISGVEIDYGAVYGEAGILTTQKKPFNLNVDRGAYGKIEYISVKFTNCRLINADNSALLPKYFAANMASNVTIQNIDICGNLNSNNTKCGIIGTDMFYRYNGTASISDINNSVLLTDGISILGANFGRQLGEQATISVNNITNYADISNSSISKIAGPIIGEDALLEASGGTVSITNCYNYGEIRQIGIGGIVGKNFCENSKNGLNVTVASSINIGKIAFQNCGGIIGSYLNKGGYASIQVVGCTNSGDIEGEYCGGIIASYMCANSYGNLLVDTCDNSGNITAATSAGIVGNYAGNNSSGTTIITSCVNNGSLIGSDLSNSTFFNLDVYPFFNPDPINDYKAAAGIVGQNCGYGLAPSGTIGVRYCKNYGNFVGDFTSGIVSFGLGFGSSGNIDVGHCENFAQLTPTCSGITVGLVGIDNSGVINFNNCKNSGDISGEYIDLFSSGLIGTIGYINNLGNETSGYINLLDCISDHNIHSSRIVHGGIVGSVWLSPSKPMMLTIESCINSINSISVLESQSFIGGIIGIIIDPSSVDNPMMEHEINVLNCMSYNTIYDTSGTNPFIIYDSKLVGDMFAITGDGRTHATLNIVDNSVNIIESSPTSFTVGLCNVGLNSLINVVDLYIKNKTINMIGNAVNVGKLNTNLEFIDEAYKLSAYSTFSPINASDCMFNISGNTITINEVSNSNNVSGILFNCVTNLSGVEMSISSNHITINNIDDESQNISGIINVKTDIGFPGLMGTFEGCENLQLEIRDNIIETNTPDALCNELKGNGTIFSVTPGTGTPTYSGPTGQLVITGNQLSPNFFTIPKRHLSDYYFPAEFRPYIYNLQPEYPGSNYWFGPDEPIVLLDGELYTGAREVGSKSDDVNLRQIFKRAIAAINEQKRFEIYPFYHIKVKAAKM